MKLRLPHSLLAALVALFVSIPASVQAVEVPEGFDSYYLSAPDELYDFRSNGQDVAFLLDGPLTITPNSATWWKSGTLMYSSSFLFTVEEDGDPYSLIFKDANSSAFSSNGSLRVEDIGRVSFSNISSDGAIHVSLVQIARNKSVTFENNWESSSTAYGGAISGYGLSSYSQVEINDNYGAVSFTGNFVYGDGSSTSSNAYGGAIYGTSIAITGNGGTVSFTGNYASATTTSSYSSCSSYGGAIYGRKGALISMEGNKGGICISRNYSIAVRSNIIYSSYGGAIYCAENSQISIVGNDGDIDITENGFRDDNSSSSYWTRYGGAIYLHSGELNIRDNTNQVTIAGNRANYGGAFYAGAAIINLEATRNNIVFEANSAGSYGGAIYGSGSTLNLLGGAGSIIFDSNIASNGGAVYGEGCTINICNSTGDVSFVGNSASSYGGAIYDKSSVINICNNTGDVSFTGNTAKTGAAIYGGSLVIQNNESVVFEQNLESTGRLRSIYLTNTQADGGKFYVSAAEGKRVTFTDGIYVATETIGQMVNVVFNGSFTASDESVISQGGDIIFDGEQVESVLSGMLETAPTTSQIVESQTSYVGGITNLKAGRLIIRNGAQYNGLGISTTARSGAAVVLENASMDHSSGSINIRKGTSLELNGCNRITTGSLTMSSGSTLGFTVGAEQRTSASLVLNSGLDHFSITIALDGADMLASGRYKLVELADASLYTSDDYWNADGITVTATGDAAGLGFDNLVWENGVLYVEQGKSIWSNGSGDGVWNASSANWQRNGLVVGYRDGMDVKFDDTAAGTVQLEGAVSPLSVEVDNSTGHDYTFAGSGSLSGSTSLEKNGSGALNLATANDYTGGTRLNGGTLNVQHSQALGAAESTVVTAAGTQLNVTNNAAVVLAAAEGNDLAGQVSVDAGASLEVQGTGYHAEATQLAGELIFSGTGVNHTGTGAGSLSGSGHLKVQGAGSTVGFSSAADFAGSVSLAEGAILGADVLEVKAGAMLSALAAGTSLGLGDVVGSGAAQVEMHTSRFESYTGTLNVDVAANAYTAGTIETSEGLVLQGGATYQATGSSLDLGGSTLTLSTGNGNPFVSLMLALDGSYMPVDTQIVLFTGVSSLVVNGVEFSGADTAHVFAASDYLKGDYVFETTALVYDGNVGCVYLVEAMPEPATTTLSLLALAGLCARRRRR